MTAGRKSARLERSFDRRSLLRAAFGASIGGAGLLRAAGLRAQPDDRLRTTALRPGLTQLEGAGGNVLLLDSGDGIGVVDSGQPDQAVALSQQIRALTGDGRAIDLLFNTHWHLAHTGGNDQLAAPSTRIIAHENTRLWMSTEYYVDWQDRTYEPRAAAALPNETFFTSDPQPIELVIGDERLEYGHLREAHTDGDIYVYLRERNVIATGGVVAVGAYPVPDHATGGWIGGLMDATQRLLELCDADTLVVPGRGPAQTRAHLEAQYAMVSSVRGRIEDLMRKGRSADEMLAAGVTAEFDAAWGTNRERFVANVYDGLWWQGRLDGSL